LGLPQVEKLKSRHGMLTKQINDAKAQISASGGVI